MSDCTQLRGDPLGRAQAPIVASAGSASPFEVAEAVVGLTEPGGVPGKNAPVVR